MYTAAIIWGDYPETEDLIEKLRKNGTRMITVVTDEAHSVMNKYDGVVDLVVHGRHEMTREVHYRYVSRNRRRDGYAWKMFYI